MRSNQPAYDLNLSELTDDSLAVLEEASGFPPVDGEFLPRHRSRCERLEHAVPNWNPFEARFDQTGMMFEERDAFSSSNSQPPSPPRCEPLPTDASRDRQRGEMDQNLDQWLNGLDREACGFLEDLLCGRSLHEASERAGLTDDQGKLLQRHLQEQVAQQFDVEVW